MIARHTYVLTCCSVLFASYGVFSVRWKW